MCSQIALPMAVLVDCVFWLVLFPEAIRYHTVAYQLTFVSLHTQMKLYIPRLYPQSLGLLGM